MEKKLLKLCEEIFVLIPGLRQSNITESVESLRREVMVRLNQFEAQGRAQGIDSKDLSDMKFAFAALIDEIILNSQWPGKESWQFNPLAVEQFSIFNAGEEFFNKLNEIRNKGRQRAEVLEIYYLCLVLGFKGQYGLYGPERLKTLMDEVYEQLRPEKGRQWEDLSPHWQRTDEFMQQVSGIPIWAIVVSGVGIALLILLFLKLLVNNKIGSVVEELSKLV